MDSTDIKSFLTVIRTGNVTTAARFVNTTQSALSKRIKNLEHELGFELLLRGKGQKHIELTSAGIQFMELAQRWQSLLQDMSSLRDMEQHQLLNVGVLDSVQPLTRRFTRRLLAENKEIFLRLQVSTSENMYTDLDKRSLDVGFSNMERPMPSVRRQLLFQEPFVAVCAKDHVPPELEGKDVVSPAELDPAREVFTRWWSPGYVAWHENHWPARTGTRLSVSSPHLVLMFMEQQGYWAVLPYSLAREVCMSRRCVMFQFSPAPPMRLCYLLTHKQPRASARAAIDFFLSTLYATIREDMPWLRLAGSPAAGSTAAGGTAANGPAPGSPAAGDIVTSSTAADDIVTGEPVAGGPAAGDIAASGSATSSTAAGDIVTGG